MPIIYMHGVNTRDPKHAAPVIEYLRRIVAPAISDRPQSVSIVAADWFQHCDPPKWRGASRPRTALLGHGGGDTALREDIIEAILKEAAEPAGATADPMTSGRRGGGGTVRLDKLEAGPLSDLIVLTVAGDDPAENARIGVAADAVSRDPVLRARLGDAASLDGQIRILIEAVDAVRRTDGGSMVAQGAGKWLSSMKERIGEGVSRLAGTPGVAASKLLGELRPGLNDLVTRFLGDVLFYMTRRGTPADPGPIPEVLIDALQTAAVNKAERKEPIVLLTHSMGGQIAYDVLTSFLPAVGSTVKVDFWCATASQVGFFEEMNLFLASSRDFSEATGKPTPFPNAHLAHWWNVWDTNDILSFTTRDIFAAGIEDGEYKTGLSIAAAHGGYLERPSFYRQLAGRLERTFA